MKWSENSFEESFGWSRFNIALSCVVAAALLGIVWFVVAGGGSAATVWSVVAIVAVVLVLLCCFNPRKLRLDSEALSVEHIIGRTRIPLSEIVSVNRIDRNDVSGSMRLVGFRGLGGEFGIFRNSALGRYVRYTTQLENLVCIRTTGKTYVLNSRTLSERLA